MNVHFPARVWHPTARGWSPNQPTADDRRKRAIMSTWGDPIFNTEGQLVARKTLREVNEELREADLA